MVLVSTFIVLCSSSDCSDYSYYNYSVPTEYLYKSNFGVSPHNDVSAVFDTVDHEILLKRLNASFGLSGTLLLWLRSYLTERSLCVAGPSIWNGLPVSIRSLPRTLSQTFLSQLKAVLFGRVGVGSASE